MEVWNCRKYLGLMSTIFRTPSIISWEAFDNVEANHGYYQQQKLLNKTRLSMQHRCCTQKWIRHQWRISPENLALLWELALKLRQTTPRAWYDSQLPIAGVARGGAHDKRTQLANYEDLPQCFSRSRLRPLWGLHSFHILFIWCSLWLIHCLSRLKTSFGAGAIQQQHFSPPFFYLLPTFEITTFFLIQSPI